MLARGKRLGSENRRPASRMTLTKMTFHRGNCSIVVLRPRKFAPGGRGVWPGGELLLGCRFSLGAGGRLALAPHLGNRAAQDLDPNAFRNFHLQLLILDLRHLADDAAAGDDAVATADGGDHVPML